MKKDVYFLTFIFCILNLNVYATRYYVKPDGDDLTSGTAWETAFATLTQAADVATSGSEVWVAWGVYPEGKEITIAEGVSFYGGFKGIENQIQERDKTTTPTTINGMNYNCCVINHGIMDGFHVTNDNYTFNTTGGGIYNNGIVSNCIIFGIKSFLDYSDGTGIYNDYGIVTDCEIFENSSKGIYSKGNGIYNYYGEVVNCMIYGNIAQNRDSNGSGIYNYRGTVTNCMIFENSLNEQYSSGSGIYSYYGDIVNCAIYGNITKGYTSPGGGIYNYYGTVKGCFVHDNILMDSSTGGGIYNHRGELTGCAVFENSASNAGGIYNSSGYVINCIIYKNIALRIGGGIYNVFSGNVINCTIYRNQAYNGGGIWNPGNYIINTIIWKNQGGDVEGDNNKTQHCCFGGALNENGNFTADPFFINTSGDASTWNFHLKNGSPCIDAGTTDTAKLPDMDIEGKNRPGKDAKVCMGAYESQDEYLSSEPLPSKRLYIKTDGNDEQTGTSWDTAFKTINKAVTTSDLDDTRYEVWVAEGTYKEGKSIYISSYVSLYGGFIGTESEMSQRDIVNHQTIIDGENSYPCVNNHGIIDGLYVTKGYGENGSGICNSNGYVNNCRIYANTSKTTSGGVYNNHGFMINCAIYENLSEQNGGGVFNINGKIDHCMIWGNDSLFRGGGIFNSYGDISDCCIYNNVAGNEGGGIWNTFSGTVTRCKVFGNSLRENDSRGGGIYNNWKVSDCLVYGNEGNWGGGIYNYNGKVTNCTIYENTGWNRGGGIYNMENSMITNCISWKNIGGDILGDSIQYSCFGEAMDENGNFSQDPIFTDTSGDISSWDFHLMNGSPCIDNGTSDTTELSYSDIEGNERPGGDGKVCMGAYESPDEFLPGEPLIPFKRIYIKTDGNNDNNGTSWDDAVKTITKGISISFQDDSMYEIWAGYGTYMEEETVYVPSFVELYGGFAGTENNLEQRDSNSSPTIIHGNDEHRCVMNNGMIDGIHITRGKCSEDGAGILNYGKINNCHVYQNVETGEHSFGGGIYNYGEVTNCDVYKNFSEILGGGIYNDGGNLINCSIYENISKYSGGGIVNRSGKINNCSIYGNTEGGISNYDGEIIDSDIHNNYSSSDGGGIINDEGNVINCTIFNNKADRRGGGIYNDKDFYSNVYPKVLNCAIYGNEAMDGGGIYNYAGYLTDCIIYHNKAAVNGGGIYQDCRGDKINQCKVYENTATTGGGIYLNYGNVINSVICGNEALAGGGINSHLGEYITNCTIYSNRADLNGGGLKIYDGTITNCISWKNWGGDIMGPIDVKINNSCYGEAKSENGNFISYPLFMDVSGDIFTWDLRLQNGSPCVDAGRLYQAPQEDMEGNPRPGGDGKVCLGAYESPDDYIPGEPFISLKRLYVKPDGSDEKNGSSWDEAMKTINGAISRSMQDELYYEIWIRKGLYREGQTIIIPPYVQLYGGFDGTEIQMEQRDISYNNSVIDGENVFRCVKNFGFVDGFHIIKGKSDVEGGGIYNYSGKVNRCSVYGNIAKEKGGGIVNYYNGTISNCMVYQNNLFDPYSFGGGIFTYKGNINNCIVYNNTSNYSGGGIHNNEGNIRNCIVYNNNAGSRGGGIYNKGTAVNCIVYHNTLTWDIEAIGGGIYNDSGKVENCTISRNHALTAGSGIYNDQSTLKNSIIWNNHNNNIYRNNDIVQYCCFNESSGEDNSISDDPLFINDSGDMLLWDFHLEEGSPCIDTGDPNLENNDNCLPPGKGTERNDIGAYGGPGNCEFPEIIPPKTLLGVLTEYGDAWAAQNFGSPPFDQSYRRGWLGFRFSPSEGWYVLKGDADQMGLDDLIQITKYGDAWVSKSYDNINSEPTRWGWLGFKYDERDGYNGWLPISGDANGDGACDLIQVTEYGDAWVAPSEIYQYTEPERWGWLGFEFSRGTKGESGAIPLSGDANGDGFDDLIQITRYRDVWVACSGETIYNSPVRWGWIGFQYAPYDGWYPMSGDVDADGKDDLVQITPTGDPWVALSLGDSYTSPSRWGWINFYYNEELGYYPLLEDVNADGRKDLIQITPEGEAWIAPALDGTFDVPEYWGKPYFLFSREKKSLPFFLDN